MRRPSALELQFPDTDQIFAPGATPALPQCLQVLLHNLPVGRHHLPSLGVGEGDHRGEATCRVVYGDNYLKLRQNVRALHPALDAWMLIEGYGRTLSRPGLDLKRREFCVIAQTAVLDTPRQLHSHLRGALHAGATLEEVDAVLVEVNPFVAYDHWKGVKELWEQVRDGWEPLA